jgi:hypothetical protein
VPNEPAAPLAHVLQNANVPVAVLWSLAGLMVLGLLIGLLHAQRWVRRGGWTVCLVAAAVYEVVTLVYPPAPQAPAYAIRLAQPVSGAPVGTPVAVEVCARASMGTPTKVPDGDHVLAVIVDGVEIAVMHVASFSLPMQVGRHHLRVELLTNDHRAFRPEVKADTDISVSGPAPLPTPAPCGS